MTIDHNKAKKIAEAHTAAWNSGSAEAKDGGIVCNELRCADNHILYLWTFTGTHSGTQTPLAIRRTTMGDLVVVMRARKYDRCN
jgi:hypothetical protein